MHSISLHQTNTSVTLCIDAQTVPNVRNYFVHQKRAGQAHLLLRINIDDRPYLGSCKVIYQIVYSSQATSPMSLSDLEEMLVDARTENEKRSITGALIYVDDVFIQVLEGKKDTVLSLMQKIERVHL